MENKGPDAGGELVGGLNAVLAALAERPLACRRLLVAEGRHSNAKLDQIFDLARTHNLSIKIAPRKVLDRQYGRQEHQGVLAIFDSKDYADFDDFCQSIPQQGPALILALDRVEDPGNLGALLRSAAAFNVLEVLIPRERAAALTPTALSAAAGAAEHLPLMRVVNLKRSLETLKERGFWLVGAEGSGADNLFSFKFPERAVLVLGSEGRGLGPLIAKSCDFLVSIPQNDAIVSSLNVSVAGAVLLFEYARQRNLSPAL